MKNKKIIFLIGGIALLAILLLLAFNVFLPSDQKPKETPVPLVVKKESIQKTETKTATVQVYDSENLRDPFAPLIIKRQIGQKTDSPLEAYDVEELKLTGVIFDKKGTFALIEAPDGKFYIVREKDKIGISGGMVTKISKDFIEIKETPLYGGISPKTKQLKLRTEE